MGRLLRCIVVLAMAMAAVSCAGAQSFPLGALDGLAKLQPGRTMRSSSSDPNWATGNGDARPIAPGGTLVLADLEGPGVIRHIWNTIAATERYYSRLLVIRMYWDGEENPSVECPIGDFFGMGHGLDVPFASLPIRVTSEGRARNCYWPMPFRKSARITVTNEGRGRINAFYYYVDWQKLPKLDNDTAYFHAMYRQEFPAVMGQRYLLADIEGRGHYVGTVLSCRQNMPSWFGEGDDFFFIDGEEEPSLRGTGTEDYFCDAWGFREYEGLFYGAPLFEGFEVGNRTTVFRWHIPDPVTFEKSLRVEIEHVGPTFNDDGSPKAGYGERPDDDSSVAFWYQQEPHKPYEPLPAAYDRIYYDFSKAIQAEGLRETAEATAGGVATQEGGQWDAGGQLFWTPDLPEQTLTLQFDVAKAGTYDMLALVTHSWDYGTFQFELDGQALGKPLDLLNSSVIVREHTFPKRPLEAGRHVLTIKNVGKSVESKGYFFGLDALLLSER
jgi:D-arabinan exo alpha-(1,3)/(1,5)-arabinofuranosidase (non-reducing end)